MNYQELLKYKTEIKKIFSEYGVVNPRVFGSTIRNQTKPRNDIDFLISWPTKHDLLDRIALKNELETLLDTKVDLVTDKTLHPLIKDNVLREAKTL